MLECTFSVSRLIRLSGVGPGSVLFLLQTGCAYVARASFELKGLSLSSAKTKSLSVCSYVSICMSAGAFQVKRGTVCLGLELQVVVRHLTRMLGTELVSLERALPFLNH